jgi:hypothetical protein
VAGQVYELPLTGEAIEITGGLFPTAGGCVRVGVGVEVGAMQLLLTD